MTINLRTALVVLAIALGSAVPASAQAVCEDCQPLTNQLRTLQDQLAEAEALYKEIHGRVVELEESSSQESRKALPGYTLRLEALRGDVLRLMQAVKNAETRLRLCQRGCETPRQPRTTDPSDSNFIDENLPRAACAKCQPHVDRVLDLQRRRRFVRNQLRSIDNHMSEWAGRMDVAGAPQGGLLLLQDRAAAVGRIDALTAEIAQALAELTACNEPPCGPKPGGGTTPVTPQTGSGSPPGVTPPPTTCRKCDEAARALADAEARKKLVADELAEYERTEQQNEQRTAEQQQARRDRLNLLKAAGQGGGDEAFDLDMEIRSLEYEQKVRQEVLGDDPYPKDLQKRLSTLEEEVSDQKKKFEDCQKECKPTEHSQLFRGPLPYVAGGAVALGALLIGGGDAPPVTTTGQVPSAPPAAPTAQQPTPAPPSTPAPAPEPAPTVGSPAGPQRLRTCVCENNQAALDADILFCQRVAQLLVASPVFGTMSIAGADPVLPAQGAFNQSTGAFDFSTTGHVGGVGTVTLRYAGTIDANGNLTATITYTVNGRSTVYRIGTTRG